MNGPLSFSQLPLKASADFRQTRAWQDLCELAPDFIQWFVNDFRDHQVCTPEVLMKPTGTAGKNERLEYRLEHLQKPITP